MTSFLSRIGRALAWLEVQSHRNKLYRAAVLASPVLITAGLLTSGDAQILLGVLAVLAGAGVPSLAARHSNPKKVGR